MGYGRAATPKDLVGVAFRHSSDIGYPGERPLWAGGRDHTGFPRRSRGRANGVELDAAQAGGSDASKRREGVRGARARDARAALVFRSGVAATGPRARVARGGRIKSARRRRRPPPLLQPRHRFPGTRRLPRALAMEISRPFVQQHL